jgi:hypothetical protein
LIVIKKIIVHLPPDLSKKYFLQEKFGKKNFLLILPDEQKWHFRSSGKVGMKKNGISGHSAR